MASVSEKVLDELGGINGESGPAPSGFLVFRDTGGAVGAFTAQIDEILWRGEPDVLGKIRKFQENRPGTAKLRFSSFVHVGIELSRGSDFSVS